MMRILQCVPGNMDVGGIETFLMNVYRNIDKEKFQFDFLVHKQEENFFEKEIISMGGRIIRLPNKRKRFFEYRRQFKKIVRNYKLIHINSVYAFSYFECKWAKQLGVKVVLHSHNSNASLKRRVLHNILKRLQLKYFDLGLAPSRLAGQWMFNSEIINNENKFKLVYNGFNVNSFSFSLSKRTLLRSKLNLKDNEFVLGSVGRLDRQKDPMFMLKVFNLIHSASKHAKLVVIGSGTFEKEIERYVIKHKLDTSVVLLGNKKNVNDYLNAFDAFILPTRYEGLGISLVEAQINGLKVFTTNVIPREAVVNKNYTELLSKANGSIWKEAIFEYMNSAKLDRNIDIKLFDNYQLRTTVNELAKIYSSFEAI